MSLSSLKKEVAALKGLTVGVEDNSVLIMRINGKDYTSKNIGEGNQALIEFSRALNAANTEVIQP